MFTIIIPTHNRPDKLTRCISYYSELGISLIVVDSSTVKYDRSIPDRVEYHHMPSFNFAEKILFAAELCSSDFVALCADDDFLLKGPLNKASDEMNADKDISISFGSFVRFDEGCTGPFKLVPRQNYLRGVYKRDVDKNLLINRFMKHYDQVLWSMYRKDLLIDIFKAIKKSNYTNDNFIELTIASIAVFEGKLNILPGVWGVRELSKGEHWGGRHAPISQEDLEDKQKFIDNVSKITSEKYAEQTLISYVGNVLRRKLMYRFNNSIRFIFEIGQERRFREVVEFLDRNA